MLVHSKEANADINCHCSFPVLSGVRLPSQLPPLPTSRRPKPPSWCQTHWWSPLQTTGWGGLCWRVCSPTGLHFYSHVSNVSSLGVSVHVRVLPVQRQHLQVPDVSVSSPGGASTSPPTNQLLTQCFWSSEQTGQQISHVFFLLCVWRRRVRATAPSPPQLKTASGVKGHPTRPAFLWSVNRKHKLHT